MFYSYVRDQRFRFLNQVWLLWEPNLIDGFVIHQGQFVVHDGNYPWLWITHAKNLLTRLIIFYIWSPFLTLFILQKIWIWWNFKLTLNSMTWPANVPKNLSTIGSPMATWKEIEMIDYSFCYFISSAIIIRGLYNEHSWPHDNHRKSHFF